MLSNSNIKDPHALWIICPWTQAGFLNAGAAAAAAATVAAMGATTAAAAVGGRGCPLCCC